MQTPRTGIYYFCNATLQLFIFYRHVRNYMQTVTTIKYCNITNTKSLSQGVPWANIYLTWRKHIRVDNVNATSLLWATKICHHDYAEGRAAKLTLSNIIFIPLAS